MRLHSEMRSASSGCCDSCGGSRGKPRGGCVLDGTHGLQALTRDHGMDSLGRDLEAERDLDRPCAPLEAARSCRQSPDATRCLQRGPVENVVP